jgi:hypothetical protein
VLQVSPRAHPEVLAAAYRVLARRYHPDTNQAPASAQQMQRLNDAYAVLADPERRAQYDAASVWAARDAAAAQTGPNHNQARQSWRAQPDVVPVSSGWLALLGFVMALVVGLGMAFWIVVEQPGPGPASAVTGEPNVSTRPDLQILPVQSGPAPYQDSGGFGPRGRPAGDSSTGPACRQGGFWLPAC